MVLKFFLFSIFIGFISNLLFFLLFKKIDMEMVINKNKVNLIIMRISVLSLWLITGIVGTFVTDVIYNNDIVKLNKYILLGVFGILGGLLFELVTGRYNYLLWSKHKY